MSCYIEHNIMTLIQGYYLAFLPCLCLLLNIVHVRMKTWECRGKRIMKNDRTLPDCMSFVSIFN